MANRPYRIQRTTEENGTGWWGWRRTSLTTCLGECRDGVMQGWWLNAAVYEYPDNGDSPERIFYVDEYGYKGKEEDENHGSREV